MRKMKKSILIASCLILVSTSIVFADSSTIEKSNLSTFSEEKAISSCTILGYEFTYENAPKFAKEEYEKSCEELNITPDKNHKIFITEDAMDLHNIDGYNSVTKDPLYIEFKGSYFLVTGSKNYRVDIAAKSSIVGYNNTTEGNPVHLAQVLCNKIVGSGISTDGQFGPATYNAVKSLQGKLGLTKDGIVGKNTWEAAGKALK
ncbi:peptidoglycan-binding protein [Clostridioides difficile]|nr:peptidoglycan-binding protein [Clostridioides difficile]